MIAIDIFADLYEWDDKTRERGHRVADATSTIFMSSRGGSKSPMVFVDAALSVLDAIDAYARYRQAEEITRQLEIEADMLCVLISELDAQLLINLKVADLSFESKLKILRMHLERKTFEIQIEDEKLINLFQQVKNLGSAIASIRINSSPGCTILLQMERTYYRLVDLQLQTAMDFVKE